MHRRPQRRGELHNRRGGGLRPLGSVPRAHDRRVRPAVAVARGARGGAAPWRGGDFGFGLRGDRQRPRHDLWLRRKANHRRERRARRARLRDRQGGSLLLQRSDPRGLHSLHHGAGLRAAPRGGLAPAAPGARVRREPIPPARGRAARGELRSRGAVGESAPRRAPCRATCRARATFHSRKLGSSRSARATPRSRSMGSPRANRSRCAASPTRGREPRDAPGPPQEGRHQSLESQL